MWTLQRRPRYHYDAHARTHIRAPTGQLGIGSRGAAGRTPLRCALASHVGIGTYVYRRHAGLHTHQERSHTIRPKTTHAHSRSHATTRQRGIGPRGTAVRMPPRSVLAPHIGVGPMGTADARGLRNATQRTADPLRPTVMSPPSHHEELTCQSNCCSSSSSTLTARDDGSPSRSPPHLCQPLPSMGQGRSDATTYKRKPIPPNPAHLIGKAARAAGA